MTKSKANKPILLVMAAGMGSRYGGLKQMDPVGSMGETILDFSLYDAMYAGFERAVFVIKEEISEDFHKLIDDRAGRYFDVDYAYQKLDDVPEGVKFSEGRKKPWGTAHAVYSAREKIDAPFCVINADDYYGPGAFITMYEALEFAAETGAQDYSMVAFRLGNTMSENGHVARGICEITDDGMLAKVTERTMIEWKDGSPAFSEDGGGSWEKVSADTKVSMNFWGLPGDFTDKIGERFPCFVESALTEDPEGAEFYLPKVVQDLIDEEGIKVNVMESRDKWYGVTYKEDRESVVSALASMKDEGLYPEELFR